MGAGRIRSIGLGYALRRDAYGPRESRIRRSLDKAEAEAATMHRGETVAQLASMIGGRLGWQVRRAGLPTCPGAESMWGTSPSRWCGDPRDTSKRNALLSSWTPLTLATSQLPQGSGSSSREPRRRLRHLIRPWMSLILSVRGSGTACLATSVRLSRCSHALRRALAFTRVLVLACHSCSVKDDMATRGWRRVYCNATLSETGARAP